MLTKQKISIFAAGVLLVFMAASCYYDATLEPLTPEVTTEVSFSKDILPIFNQSCNGSGCHNAGGTAPDLSPANAFNSLVSGNHINIATPEQSNLYKWMRGEGGLPMPISGPNAAYNATVLAWIQQGAKNN